MADPDINAAHNQPHKYRCETCENTDCPVWLPDNARLAQKGKMRGNHHILAILSKCGCASHSSATKAEQRIEDVIAELACNEKDAIQRYEHATTMNEEVYQQGIVFGIQKAIALLRGEE